METPDQIVPDSGLLALVARSQVGDRDAFDDLVRSYYGRVCAVAAAVTGREDACEEVAQETFLRAFRQIGTLREPARFLGWVCRIAEHTSQEWIRERGRRARLGRPEWGAGR